MKLEISRILILLFAFMMACQEDDELIYVQELGTCTDKRDGHIYDWTKIGSQIWMAENLDYDIGEGCWGFDNDEISVPTNGRLYFKNFENACPEGWHLPSDKEWDQLFTFISKHSEDCEEVEFGWL